MLLVIDVGNTNTVIGVFKKSKLLKNWRIRTERNATEDEFNILINNLFAQNAVRHEDINRTIISCVVPPVIENLDAFCKKHLKHDPHWVDAKSTTQMPILYNNPEEVGADRIVNSVAAFHLYKQSLIVIHFGTATTFDVISEKGEYLGGAISPGGGSAAESLLKSASKLPRVELISPPEKVIGKDTANSIKSGIIFGYAGLVDGIVRRIKKEMGSNPKVIATGGLAVLLSDVSETIENVEPDLTLNGLRLIADSL
jgi:type III pantothenate kinase